MKRQQAAMDEQDAAFEAQMTQCMRTIDTLQSSEAQIVAKCAALGAELGQIRASNRKQADAFAAQTAAMEAQSSEAAAQMAGLGAHYESLSEQMD